MLHDLMATEGARLLLHAVPRIAQGNYKLTAQDSIGQSVNNQRNAAPKIQRSDASIDWAREGRELVNFVRAFGPAPGAYTFLDGKRMVILQVIAEDMTLEFNIPIQDSDILTEPIRPPSEYPAGYCLVRGKKWWIRSGNSWLRVIQIKPENSKAMSAEDFLRGHADVDGRICSKEL